MIFFENNQTKIFSLFVLVATSAAFVIWGWFRFNPLSQAADQPADNYWSDLGQATGNTGSDIKDSLEVGFEQAENIGVELERQAKADALLEATKEYLNNTSTVTSTSQ